MTFQAPRLKEWYEAAAARGETDAKSAARAGLWGLLLFTMKQKPRNPLMIALHEKMIDNLLEDLITEYEGQAWIESTLKPCVEFLMKDSEDFLRARGHDIR